MLIKWFNPVIWAGIAVALIYEGIAVFNKAPQDTISSVVWRNAGSRWWIPMLFGALMGHFFMGPKPVQNVGFFLVGLGIASLVWHQK